MTVIDAARAPRLLTRPLRPGVTVHADLYLPSGARSQRKQLVFDRTEVELAERIGGRKTLRHTRYTYLGYSINRRGAISLTLSEVHGGGVRAVTLAKLLEVGTVKQSFQRGRTIARVAAERKALEGAR